MWLSPFPQFGDPQEPVYTCFQIASLSHSSPLSFSNLKVDYTGVFSLGAQQKELPQFDWWSFFQFSVTDRRNTSGVSEMSPVKSPKNLNARDIRRKNKLVFEKVVEEELPPGWKMEVKTRKSAKGKKRDRYYTDPVTGYIFRSLTDVQRYLKTGALGRHAKKPKITETDNKMVEDDESSKEQMVVSSPLSETVSNKRPLEDGSVTSSKSSETSKSQRASKRLAGVTIDTPPPPPPPPSPPVSKTCKATRLSDIKVDALPPPPPPPSPPEPKTRQARQQAGMEIVSPQEPKTRKATPLAEPPPPPPPPEPKTSQQVTARQEGEAETQPPVLLAIPKEKDSDNDGNADMAAKIPVVTKESLKKADENQEPHTPATPAALPPVNHEQKPPPPPPPQESSSINEFWTDPCIEFAVKTLTGAIPFGDLNKADKFPLELEVPMEELWTDPCIEFAVKTLTGAIPVGDYSHRQPTTTSDMGMNFHFETGNNNNNNNKNKNKQLDSVGQKSGNIGFHQVNGSNGQSRFFK